jgi:hypothetical protein
MNLGVGCENERFEQFKSELSGGNGEGKLWWKLKQNCR